MSYRFFDHTADIGVTIRGPSRAELFAQAARALYAAAGELVGTGPALTRALELEAPGPEDLLHDWLAELLFELETHHVWYPEIAFTNLTATQLTAQLGGQSVDLARSRLNQEIKAVTYHQLRVAQLSDGQWEATVIFDV